MVNSSGETLVKQYMSTSAIPSLDMPLPGIETELISALPGSGTGLFDYHSTLRVSAASVLGDIYTIICDGGSVLAEARQTVELRCESE